MIRFFSFAFKGLIIYSTAKCPCASTSAKPAGKKNGFRANGLRNYLLPLMFLLGILQGNKLHATVYYNQVNKALRSTANWGTNTDGTGTTPGNFTTAGDTFRVDNAPAATTIGGSGWTTGAIYLKFNYAGTITLDKTITGTSTVVSIAIGTTVNSGIAQSFGSLIVNGTFGATTFNTTIGSDLTINSGGTFSQTTGTLAVTGDITNAGTLSTTSGSITATGSWASTGTFTSGTGTVTFNSAVAGHTISGSLTGTNKFNNIIFNNASPGTYTFSSSADVGGNFTFSNTGTVTAPSGTLSITGNFSQSSSGTFSENGGTINVGGNFARTNGTYTASGGTVNLNGSAAQSVPGIATTFNTLSIANTTRTITGNAAITVGSSFTVPSSVTLDMGTNIFTASGSSTDLTVDGTYSVTLGAITVGRDFTIGSTGTYTSTTAPISVTRDFTNNGTYAASTASLTVTRNFSNSSSYTTSGNQTLGINGNFTNSGTFSPGGTETITVAGGWANTGTFTYGTTGGTVTFDGSDGLSHSLTGTMTGASAFNNLTISGTANTTYTFGANAADVLSIFTISNNSQTITLPSSTLKVTGTFNIAGSTPTFNHNNGTVELSGTSTQTFPGTAKTFYDVINNHTGGQLTIATCTIAHSLVSNYLLDPSLSTTIITGTGATLSGTGTLNVSRNGDLKTQYAFSTYTLGNMTVSYNASTAQTINSTTTLGSNYGSLFVTTSGVVAKTLEGNITVNNDVTITGSGTTSALDLSASNYKITLGGNWTNNSTASSSPYGFNKQSGTVALNGTSAQTISGTNTSYSFYNLTDNNSGAALNLSVNINVAGTFSVASGAIVAPDPTVQINSSAAAGTMSGSGTINVTRIAATADYSNQYKFTTNTLGSLTVDYIGAGAQNVNAFTYGTLKTSTSGTKTAQGNITVNTLLNVASGTTLDMGTASALIAGTSPTYSVSGTLKTSVPTATTATPLPSGATWGGPGTVEYASLTGAQTVVSGTYGNITLDNTSGINSAGGTITVNGTITLGKLSLGSSNLILGSAGTISGASSSNYFVTTGTGKLRKPFTANGAFTYPVGDASNYTPITVTMSGSGYTAAYAEANVTASKHPNNANTTNYLNRYWTINTSGISGQNYSADATYVSGDVTGSDALTSAGQYTGSLPWARFSGANTGSRTITVTAVSNSSSDISGITTANPNIVNSGNVTICAGQSTTLSATGTTGDPTLSYSWSPATSLSATTGVSVVASPTTTVTYTLTVTDGNGFSTSGNMQVSVNPTPAAITGNSAVCKGASITLANITSSGTWQSSNGAIATVGSATGILNGIAAGNATISYILPTGCYATAIATVNTTPSAITGTTSICEGGTTTLSSSPAGGIWTSVTTSVATIGSSNGVATGVVAGTSTISYTLSTGCYATTEATVNPSLATTGIQTVCVGSTTLFENSIPSGTWSSSATSIATVGSSDGIVTGVAAGTALITYQMPSGCLSMRTVTVNALPLAITGTASVCEGATTTLANATAGGTWTSATPTVAIIGSSDGIATGILAGNTTVSYTLSTGCYRTAEVTVNASPAAITGSQYACIGTTTTFENTIASGTWISGDLATATVGSSDGIITGVAAGTSVISYQMPGNCITTRTVTVSAVPSSITGLTSICGAGTVTLSAAGIGGTWSSQFDTVATIDVSTGVVSSTGLGQTDLTYFINTGCSVSITFTVNPTPGPITGTKVICTGYATTLGDAYTGGTWVSADPAVAAIGSSSGLVNGLTSGTASITYTLPTGCLRTTTVTVNQTPSAITGTSAVCVGSAITLSETDPGGSWISAVPSAATVGSSTGIVTGVGGGSVNISYKLPNGCSVIKGVTVNTLPVNITGTYTACTGLTTTLYNVTGGGSWMSSNNAVATIGSSTGIVSGITSGNITMTYKITATGCSRNIGFTVNPTPSAITGSTPVCSGSTITLANTLTGGTWASSNSAIAPVNSATGVVTGSNGGTSTITYKLPTGCMALTVATVNSLPNTISGTASVCAGLTTTLANSTTGGTWSSSNTGIANVGTSGIVTGISGGTAAITYTIGSGCYVTRIVTINLFNPITGTTSACVGGSTTLSNATPGGTWTSSNPSLATIGSATGIVSAIAPGTVSVSYTLSTGCRAMAVYTVYPSNPITGAGTVCTGQTATLSNSTTGGTWASSAAGIATAGSSTGIIAGLSAGTSVITYTLSSGCKQTYVVTVNASPAVITGPSSVCYSSSITMSDVTASGTWASANTLIATISSSTGIITPTGNGPVTISYTLPSGCAVTNTITVNPLPQGITGLFAVCENMTTTLENVTTGGTWSSSLPGVATIGSSTGVVTGIAAGNTAITYTLPTGCYVAAPLTVNTTPAGITGMAEICEGASLTLADATAGGTWLSGSAIVASVGSSSGMLTGGTAGNANITYMLPTGCKTMAVATVNTQPTAITGSAVVCAGAAATLNNTTSGGSWMSGTPSVATIGSSDGVVTGVLAGNSTITYTLGTACIATKTVTVYAAPTGITGTTTVCSGQTSTLSADVPGGTWSSDNTGVAAIDLSSGVFTGAAAGTATITYTAIGGCIVTSIVTVNAIPSEISGASTLCAGYTLSLSTSPSAGTWSSSNTSTATIDASSGVLSGVGPGSSTITYSLLGCTRTRTVTVYSTPVAISGPDVVCYASTITLENADAGGVWASNNAGIAAIGSSSGVITGTGNGPVTISYTLGVGCSSVKTITVNPLPQGITGTNVVCEDAATMLADITSGGTWSSGDETTATIGPASGTVTGTAAGNATISYIMPSGCYRTITVTVNQTPTAITGNSAICSGTTMTLADAVTGGTWSSNNMPVATIGSSTGIVSAITGGNATITYKLPTGCKTTAIVTINTQPAAITGASVICEGSTITLSDATAGGSWISGNLSAATIGSSSGILTGIAAGNTVITYTSGTACISTKSITVVATPMAITGTTAACVGASSTLDSDVPGGTWSSSNSGVAAIGSASGTFTGIAAGTARITYTVGSGCYITTVVTINGLPSAISGIKVVCSGTATTLTSTSGGTWTSSNTSVATAGSTGIITGVSAGTSDITYTMATGCMRTAAVTVNNAPAPISGPSSVCYSYSITLNDADAGGTWASSIPAAAAIGSSTGIVTGVGNGAVNISYTMPGGCSAIKTITVNPLPYGITGTATTCEGATTTLADMTTGGTWSSSATGTATVGTTGIVSGISAGNADITFTITSTGCFRTTTVTVNAAPAAITGNAPVCAGAIMNLSNDIAGGTWSSNKAITATVVSATGIVTGNAAGTATVTYKLPTACKVTAIVTVNPAPTPISGSSRVCVTNAITLASSGGGVWSSENLSAATIGTSGIVTGVGAGITNISYTIASTGCYRIKSVTVNATPDAGTISGPSAVAVSATITLTGTETGGAWTSGSTSIATVNSSTGVVTGMSAGASLITYTLNNGCGIASATYPISVGGGKAAPGADNVTGINEMEHSIADVIIFPNPNRGNFTIRGTMSANDNADVNIEVADIQGKVIYSQTSTALNGKIDKQISLQNIGANGMYMLILRTGNESKTFHFAISQ